MEKIEGQVKDLIEMLEKGEITKKEVLVEMKKRGLYHHADEPIPGIFAISGAIVWGVLCFLPVICKVLDLNIAEIPSIEISPEITYLTLFFAVVMTPTFIFPSRLRSKRGGTGGDETIVIIKEGPYRIVRHPEFLAGLAWFIALPILFNHFLDLPFTILSIFGEIAVVTGLCLQARHEEKINIKKWGDTYAHYMKDVPRFNFIKGLWNLRKKR